MKKIEQSKKLAQARAFNLGHNMSRFATKDGFYLSRCNNCLLEMWIEDNEIKGYAVKLWCKAEHEPTRKELQNEYLR